MKKINLQFCFNFSLSGLTLVRFCSGSGVPHPPLRSGPKLTLNRIRFGLYTHKQVLIRFLKCIWDTESRTSWWTNPGPDRRAQIQLYDSNAEMQTSQMHRHTHPHRSTSHQCVCVCVWDPQNNKNDPWLIHTWRVENPVKTTDIATKVGQR